MHGTHAIMKIAALIEDKYTGFIWFYLQQTATAMHQQDRFTEGPSEFQLVENRPGAAIHSSQHVYKNCMAVDAETNACRTSPMLLAVINCMLNRLNKNKNKIK